MTLQTHSLPVTCIRGRLDCRNRQPDTIASFTPLHGKSRIVTDHDIIETLNRIFRQVFEDELIGLTLSTTADEISGWDSMANITLAVEVEQAFGVKLKSAEMEKMRDIGDLVSLVKKRLAVTSG